VLEFAELASEAGVPPSVLTILTGTGETLGKTLVSHSAVKKVDVTVSTAGPQPETTNRCSGRYKNWEGDR